MRVGREIFTLTHGDRGETGAVAKTKYGVPPDVTEKEADFHGALFVLYVGLLETLYGVVL